MVVPPALRARGGSCTGRRGREVLEPSGGTAAVRSGDRPPRPEEEETWLDPLPAGAVAEPK